MGSCDLQIFLRNSLSSFALAVVVVPQVIYAHVTNVAALCSRLRPLFDPTQRPQLPSQARVLVVLQISTDPCVNLRKGSLPTPPNVTWRKLPRARPPPTIPASP